MDAVLPGDFRQLALRLQLGELRFVVCVRDRPWTQAVAERERDVVRAHDLADFAEVRIGEVLPVVREAPLGEDRATARDDACHAARGHRDVAQQHAGVDGEVVHALLALLDERIAVDLPREIFRTPAGFLERLIDGHRPDRDRGVADDPLTRLVNVFSGRQIHDRIGAPERRPAQLVHFFFNRGGHGGVADVGVDFHQEVSADDHRFELQVIDVRGDDGAAARDLIPDEPGRQSFAQGDEFHLRGDLALARIVELRHTSTGSRGAGRRHSLLHPCLAQLRKAAGDVVILRAAGVVDAERRFGGRQDDLAHRDAHTSRPIDEDFAGVGKCGGEI